MIMRIIKKSIHFWIIAAVIMPGVFVAAHANAATLVVTAPKITLDTQGESINAIEIHASFDPSKFTIADIDDGGSIINDWITPPSFSNTSGTVDLSGIIPGGIVTASGTIISIDVVPRSPGLAERFTVVSAQALLNDGKGTAAELSIKTPPLILAGNNALIASSTDTTAPDPFTPEIGSDPSIFDGAYFVAFSATDQGAGIDHYEVLEAPEGSDPLTQNDWVAAQSPYQLQDQTLRSDIYVRAFDRAGNFRIAEIPAQMAQRESRRPDKSGLLFLALGILLLGIALFSLWTRKRKHG